MRLILASLCKFSFPLYWNLEPWGPFLVSIRLIGDTVWHFDIERADLDEPGAFDVWDPANELQHVKAFNTWNKPGLRCRLIPVKR